MNKHCVIPVILVSAILYSGCSLINTSLEPYKETDPVSVIKSTPNIISTPIMISTPAPTYKQTIAPTLTPEPTSTPEQTITPTCEPTLSPTPEPTSTITPTKKPKENKSTPKPTKAPTPTPEPTNPPQPTTEPTPRPSPKPTNTPQPVAAVKTINKSTTNESSRWKLGKGYDKSVVTVKLVTGTHEEGQYTVYDFKFVCESQIPDGGGTTLIPFGLYDESGSITSFELHRVTIDENGKMTIKSEKKANIGSGWSADDLELIKKYF